MRMTIVLGLVALISGCASFRKPVTVQKTPPKEVRVHRVTTPVKRQEKKVKEKIVQSQAVWHLIYPSQVEFVLRHRESRRNEFIRVETTLSDLELPAGQYNVESVVIDGEKFDALEGQELFQFEIKKKSPTYIGSFVVECPKVGTHHFADLRKMDFFNRLHFTGSSGACELIVGNDIRNVRRAWAKLKKRPASKLQLGF